MTGPVRREILARIRISGNSDRNIRFVGLCGVLTRLGFDERTRGSHHIFTREGVEEIINLQPRDGGTAKPYLVRQFRVYYDGLGIILPGETAKPYQVRQVRGLIARYKLAEEFDE